MGEADGRLERPTRAEVDLAAARANFALAQRLAEGRQVIAVVKADAYGHGAARVAGALSEAGCERFAVLSVEEGLALRASGLEGSILVLGGVHEGADLAVEGRLTPVIHHRGHLEALAAAARRAGRTLPVHVEVDTGMRRMGVAPEEADALLADVARADGLDLEGAYTHFARGDEPDPAPTLEQIARFREVLAAARARGAVPRLVHCAHSGGLLGGGPVFDALPEMNAVRPGLMLYGVAPAAHLAADLRPVMSFRTAVDHLRPLRPGDAVGYSALFRAERATRVATLAAGYADGVPVSASNRSCVLIAGQRLPIVGRVSMDFIGVDVGDAPVALGDEATLFGEAPEGAPGPERRLPVEEAAEAAGTIAYELLVRVGGRVPRVYRG